MYEVMNMKKFINVLKRNIFYIALITGMAVLVAMVTLYNIKMESKDKKNEVSTNEVGLQDEDNTEKGNIKETISDKNSSKTEAGTEENTATKEADAAETNVEVSEKSVELIYDGKESISWPISGNVIIPYSMDTTVYFETLSCYKCSPAMVIEASEGASVKAVYKGKVAEVSSNDEIGNYLVMDLGNGYMVTYGQLQDVDVALGNIVEMGDPIGTVAAPSRFYAKEGTNLYFKITKDGEPVDPMLLIGN